MKKAISLLAGLALSAVSYGSEEDLPLSLNVGLSPFTANGLGINAEVPLASWLSVTAGTGHYGGYAVGTKFYRDMRNDGPYIGLIYGMVELEETYIEEDGRWEDDLEYGTTAIIGYRFLKPSGNYLHVGAGLFSRPKEEDEHIKGETEGGYLGYTFDLSYAIVF